jgi:hypothetical protein
MVEDPSVEGGDEKLCKVWEGLYIWLWMLWFDILEYVFWFFVCWKEVRLVKMETLKKVKFIIFFAYAHVFKIFVAVMISEYLYLVQVSYE